LVLKAKGAGFNPTIPRAATDVDLHIAGIDYKGTQLRDISLLASLHNGEYTLSGSSANRDIDFNIDLAGAIARDYYTAKGYVHLRNADLQALGISPTINSGNADLYIDAEASPDRWIYRADLKIENFDWNLPDRFIHLPNGMTAMIDAGEKSVVCHVDSRLTSIDFESSENLKKVIDSFVSVADEALAQVKQREIMMDRIQERLPHFNLRFNASGQGVLNQFLTTSGLTLDTVYAEFSNDSLFHGNLAALGLGNTGLTADTLTLNLNQRGSLLDYKAHLGNRPGTMDEFAEVNLNGYFGSNRVSAFLRQKNISGETGYRLGLTAAMRDSTVSVHLTPLNATIAYLPWEVNDDNYIDLNMSTYSVDANVEAKSRQSAILLRTEPTELGENSLHVKLTNIHVQDFTQMLVNAPPITAGLDSDILIQYADNQVQGKGSVSLSDLTYNKVKVGSFDLGLKAGLDFNGDSDVSLGLKVDNTPDALTLHTVLNQADFMPKSVDVKMQEFPLNVANAFLGKDVASLKGSLNGEMKMDGDLTNPMLNGEISCNSVGVYVPMIGSTLKLAQTPITVTNNVLHFNNFDIFGANANPLTIAGDVNATNFSAVSFNLTARADNFQPVNNDRRAGSDLYGKLFMDLNASVRGPMQHFNIDADVSVLSSTDISYSIPASTGLEMQQGTDNVVKFVNFSDTVPPPAKSGPQLMSMRINAGLTLVPGMQATVFFSGNGTDKAQINPSGTLNYFQNYMGDMRLNGQLMIGDGFAQYSIPLIGQKKFVFDPQSYLLWNGDIMNPVFNLHAVDDVKANVVEGGNSRLVNFNVGLNVTGQLAHPNVLFDLSTDDDLSIQNQLQSMSADQRQQQAMNMLLTGQYSGQGVKTTMAPLTGNVYSILTGTLNSWAAQTIRGVDLSFGVDQYDRSVDGQSSTTTSYSYQVSKSLFNNKFKINVGGNYSTDASADENLTQNLLSDVSFEYMLKQTPTLSMYVRLFRHTGFESILEGEVTETGVGFVMKRRLQNLRSLFRFGSRKRKESPDTVKRNFISLPADTKPALTDSVVREMRQATIKLQKGGEE
ncbi:MAG: translocation/assembly module TamB, partial [Muribaculaceae bacterium]|nr:translocation/assembly module TamB [Muribaculaceae bacterium]